MLSHVVRSLAGLALLASAVGAQLFEALPVEAALDLARTEGQVCLIAYPGEEPDPAFEALLASPELTAWASRGAVTLRVPPEDEHEPPVTLWVDWLPALAAVEPDGERARFRVEDWDPAEVVAWLGEVAQGRGRNDEMRAKLGPDAWQRMQQLNRDQMEIQVLSAAGDLEGLSAKYREVLSGRLESWSLFMISRMAPWGLLKTALAQGRVDDLPWLELLLSWELPLRDGTVDPVDVRAWLFVLDLLGAEQRLEPALAQAVASGADQLLDDSWSMDDDRDHEELFLAGELVEQLLMHGTPEGCGALIPDLGEAVRDALRVFGRAPLAERYQDLMQAEDGLESSGDRHLRRMALLGWPIAGAMDAEERASALDTVAAAYHAAVAGDRRREARDLTNDALTTVASRAPEHLPDLVAHLRVVDEALRAAGWEPIPWTVPPTATVEDHAGDLEADLPADLAEPLPPEPPAGDGN